MKMMNRWFTRYLHGIENGVENDARAWIVRENDKRENPTAYKEYPNPKAKHIALHLSSGGLKKGGLNIKAQKKQGKETLVDDYNFSGEKISENRKIYPQVIIRLACITK